MNIEVKKSWFRRHPVLSVLGVIVIIGILASAGKTAEPGPRDFPSDGEKNTRGHH